MSPGVGNGGDVVYTAIHFSDRFPVVRTACGKLGPSAAQWRYVDCLECLDAGPDDPRIGKRRAELIERQLDRET